MSSDSNQSIRESINKIVKHGWVDSNDVVINAKKIRGSVVKIHKQGRYKGTIDVKEYNTDVVYQYVYLSAIQDNADGFVVIPKLYSDVLCFIDPSTKKKYVTMFSHVDIIQLDSHEQVTVGVQEREPYDETDEDGKTVEELEPTGVFSKTSYTKNSIIAEVQDEDEANHSQLTIDGNKIESIVGDEESVVVLDHGTIHIKHDKAETILDDQQHLSQFGNSKVKIEDGTVYLGSDSNTDDAVLGGALADILSEILGYLGQAMTTTMMGPQPLINMAQYIKLKAQIEAWKASHTQFLTSKVQIQK